MVFSAHSSSCNYWEAPLVAMNSHCAELFTQPLPLSKSGIPADSVWHELFSVSSHASRKRLLAQGSLISNELMLEFTSPCNYHVLHEWRTMLTSWGTGQRSGWWENAQRGFRLQKIATGLTQAGGRSRK